MYKQQICPANTVYIPYAKITWHASVGEVCQYIYHILMYTDDTDDIDVNDDANANDNDNNVVWLHKLSWPLVRPTKKYGKSDLEKTARDFFGTETLDNALLC